MTLAAYLAKRGLKPCRFAIAIGINPSTITRILRNGRVPKLPTVEKIRLATHGQVTARDYLP